MANAEIDYQDFRRHKPLVVLVSKFKIELCYLSGYDAWIMFRNEIPIRNYFNRSFANNRSEFAKRGKGTAKLMQLDVVTKKKSFYLQNSLNEYFWIVIIHD